MRLALPAPPEMFPWIAERARITLTPAFRAMAAIGDDGEIAGMVGYDGWMPRGCSIHVALDDPRAIFTLRRHAFEIPFVQLKLSLLVASVLSTNAQSLELTRWLGFREKTTFQDAFGLGVDLLLFEMRREQCRWIPAEMRRAA